MKKKGFTLIELIIVVAIIGILTSIAAPKFGDIQRDAKIMADLATAKIISDVATIQYINGDLGSGDIILEKDSSGKYSTEEEKILDMLQQEPINNFHCIYVVKIDSEGTVKVYITHSGNIKSKKIQIYPKLYENPYSKLEGHNGS